MVISVKVLGNGGDEVLTNFGRGHVAYDLNRIGLVCSWFGFAGNPSCKRWKVLNWGGRCMTVARRRIVWTDRISSTLIFCTGAKHCVLLIPFWKQSFVTFQHLHDVNLYYFSFIFHLCPFYLCQRHMLRVKKPSTKVFKRSWTYQFCTVQPKTPESNLNFKDQGFQKSRPFWHSQTDDLWRFWRGSVQLLRMHSNINVPCRMRLNTMHYMV